MALLHMVVWLGLRLCSFRTLRQLLTRLAARSTPTHAAERSDEPRIAWAVSVTSRYLPLAKNCLVQALVAHTLLERHGHPASLRIGVDATGDRPFRAHAWVESRGRVIVGASGRERCMPLYAGGADRP
ncbi:MAG: lasso peptide biosynthesis B2 protein [Candidatus Rokuibacteriota bacterium]|nr:MAG: lasso peptide biosynthesis B2 protein [Candidatus Rokubacteria bacterium]